MTILFRLLIISITLTITACGKSGSSTTNNPPPTNPDTTFTNPLLSSGPDPWVIQQDTMYYYMHTLGNRLAIYSTSKMSALSKATITTVWTPPVSGAYSKELWAPELHRFQNKWYLYFAADDGNNDNHRIYVLENDAAVPTQGAWTFKGKVADTTDDRWAIDASAFEYNGQLYLVWSGWQAGANTEQDLYIAKLSDPVTITGKRVLISSPTLSWEKAGAPPAVNEGPEALINPSGQLFLTYSASGCWTDNYCLGLLTLKTGGDPLNPADWTKSPNPVFSSQVSNGAYAPGHNGFFTSRDGKQQWILYHANAQAGQGCGDARSPRMQPFTWNTDGTPNFGTPAKINTPITKPSGE
ncbi:glycoside hydrolase family 43 protein [Flavitalea sp. BT771]|uniref:glycoside hydrolase family 43 protein n=1 Tax=Flavitalea sp. BT771 TaxID=3063329 RepID=UPI0026E261AB|nr:glycoside hydrolase family 43 protein [Flavitalea sp. BT771]MDO6433198.1 glycoside hydrolase family 43 protein [Flavitalea sp. BT771]MDV6221526.1 glycoside hydrolase family 43 protein [Flavitalea sp. BT771]